MLQKREEIRSGKSKDAVTARMSFKRLFLSERYEKGDKDECLVCVRQRRHIYKLKPREKEKGEGSKETKKRG